MSNINFSDITYNPYVDRFSDGCIIDWWVWENIDTIWIHNYDKDFSGPMMDSKHLNARVIWDKSSHKNDEIKIKMNISRHSYVWKEIKCMRNCTVSHLLNTISSFYKLTIDTDFILNHRSDDDYWRDALKKSQDGDTIYMYDLIGTSFMNPMFRYDDFNHRRCSLLCNGCVRYEGINKNNEIILGS